MTVVRARQQSGAGITFRAVICGLGTALALLGTGCGSTTVDNGTAAVTLTDNNGDFTTYVVGVSTIEFIQAGGATVVVPMATEVLVDFARLSDLSELFSAAAIPVGTYTQATLNLDYTPATIAVNNNGQTQVLTPLNAAGNAPGLVTYTVKFDPANPLVITHGKSVPVAIDLDLAASNTVNLTASTPSVTVRPFGVATAKPVDTKRIHARGHFVNADTGQGNFVINMHPALLSFGLTTTDMGAVTIQPNAQTYYNVNGTVYTGSAGLAAINTLPIDTPVAAYGTLTDLSTNKPVLTATEIYAGTSLDNLLQGHLTGTVSARSGNTLTVHGARYVFPPASTLVAAGSVTVFNNATVTVGTSTVVGVDGQAVQNPGIGLISVGQQVDIAGNVVADSAGNFASLDATSGVVRLQPTTAWGTLNTGATAGQLTLNLTSLGGFEPAALNFAGTGSTPTSYVVNTGGIDETAVASSSLLRVNGLVNAFGSAPPDFNASAITPPASQTSQVIVEWPNGTTAPFTQQGASGFVVDLTNANLSTSSPPAIHTGPAVQPLPAGTLITAATADPNTVQLAIGSVTTGLTVFNTASGFATQVGTTLNGSTAVHKLVATGRYDGVGTFTASRINIVLQ
jgi:hypothetical protein